MVVARPQTLTSEQLDQNHSAHEYEYAYQLDCLYLDAPGSEPTQTIYHQSARDHAEEDNDDGQTSPYLWDEIGVSENEEGTDHAAEPNPPRIVRRESWTNVNPMLIYGNYQQQRDSTNEE